jgi:hypothetical protein
MGKVGRTLFGGPSEESSQAQSGNQAYPAISSALSPAMGYTTQAGDLMGSLLGTNGGPAQTTALTNFANTGGMKFLQDQGMQGIASNQAAKGLLGSGSTLKAMDRYNQGVSSTYLNSYMQSLLGLGNMGVSAANAVGDAGKQSTSSSKGEGAKQGVMQQMAQAIAQGVAAGG